MATTISDPGQLPLARRMWIGDGRRGASVTADGTLDWYCPSGITGPPALARLLDPAAPAVRIAPTRSGGRSRPVVVFGRHFYRPSTNVAETWLEGPGGRVSVIDFVPWAGAGLSAPRGVVRLVRALSGPLEVEIGVEAGERFVFRDVALSSEGLVADGLSVRAPTPFRAVPSGPGGRRWQAVLSLDAGEEAAVVVDGDPLSVDAARRLLSDTERAWASWLGRLAYSGPYREAVERAALSVRALTGPGGAPAGSGTTSLPRRPGSERSGDGRWVRLRDAAAAARALGACGLAEDAEAAETWLRHAVGVAPLPWPGWLDDGGAPVPEPEELRLAGWRRSGPVLAGRAPVGPDLGLAGDVVAAVGASTSGPGGRHGDPGPLSAASGQLASALDWVADHWQDADTGRWEIERPSRVYVAGRVEAWAAMQHMAALVRVGNPLDLRAVAWQQEARSLLSWLEASALAPDGGLRMDPSGDEADAALLAVAWQGPWPYSHPVVSATVDRVLERLSSGGLIHRYSDRVADERSGPDNPDVEASLLAVRALACLGRWEEAHERMETVVALGRHGWFGETAEPLSGEMLGNFPCTASSLAVIDAAVALAAGPR